MIKLFFFSVSLALALLVGQMVRVPVGAKSLQIIDLVILFQVVWIFFDSFLKALKKELPSFLLFSLAFFVLWNIFSAIYGVVYVIIGKIQYYDLMVGLMGAARFIYPIVLSAYLLSMRISYKDAVTALRWLYIVACVVVLFGVFQSLFLENFAIQFGPEYSWDVQGHRLVSIFLDPNLAASFCSAFVVFSMTLLYYMVLSKKLIVFGLSSALIAMFLTLSRGGIIGFFIALFVFMILYRKAIVKILRPGVLIGMVLLSILMFVLMFRIFPLNFLLETNRFGFSNESALNRFANISTLFDIVFDYPFFGVGFNYVQILFGDFFYGFSGKYIDGGVFLLLASLGVFGFIILVCFLLVYLQQIRLPVRFWFPITVMFIVQSMATSTIFYPLIICYYVAVISLMSVALMLRV